MEKLREIGLKLTPQRMAILQYLEGNTSHPSAEDVYKAVSRRFPTMSFATVYNTLSALSKKGEVLELTVDASKKRYDPNMSAHHHLVCTGCGRIDDIHQDFDLQVPSEKAHSYRITGSHVEFRGICPDCARKEEHSQ